jgi:hypothetical protein
MILKSIRKLRAPQFYEYELESAIIFTRIKAYRLRLVISACTIFGLDSSVFRDNREYPSRFRAHVGLAASNEDDSRNLISAREV